MSTSAQQFTAEERQSYIGASDVAAILGLDRYRTALDVFNEKLGLTEPFLGNKHTERGNRLEAVAAEEYTAFTGIKLRRRNDAFVHPEHSFIQGHIDRMVVGEQRIVEIKAPSIAAYRSHQRNGLPDSYQIQAQTYMGLSGINKLTWVIFCADAWDFISFDVEFDPTLYATAISGAVDFWNNHILAGNPPIPSAMDKPAMEFEKIGGDVTKRSDEAFISAAADLLEADRILKDADELKKLAKAALVEAIEGKHGRYEGGGLRLYYSQQAGRKTFDHKKLAATNPSLDLEPYFKTGNPFDVFKTFQIGE
jgi:putative phage-type endonuclease